MKIRVKVVPSASREDHEWLDKENCLLKIRVKAPPEKGKANMAVEKYLARILGLAKSDVSISGGHTSALKTVAIANSNSSHLEKVLK